MRRYVNTSYLEVQQLHDMRVGQVFHNLYLREEVLHAGFVQTAALDHLNRDLISRRVLPGAARELALGTNGVVLPESPRRT